MYLIRIEPVYSQGVGHFELITNNIEYVELFRNELHRYKEFLKNDDPDDLECWEFYEYVYKLVDYNQSNNKFKGYCLLDKKYSGNFKKLNKLGKNILNYKITKSDVLDDFDYDDNILADYVYNYIDNEIKPIHISNFDIIGKKYLK
jgi:hypothetical protein